ncbi:MAG: DUF2478 domain-containing protein [Salinarimonadaceae bacterium]|nr:MAG: DUF2478 domain-containing protein [Salinarimonadaceae bacterium]
MIQSRLVAIVYSHEDPIETLLRAVVEEARTRGLKVAGMLAADDDPDACVTGDMSLRDVASGRVISICQDLGPSARACRLDPQGLAQAAGLLREQIAAGVDLVVLNKFGRAEAEGAGFADEIGLCVAGEIPLLTAVPLRFLPVWEEFAGGLDERLPPDTAAVGAWLSRIGEIA